MCWTSISPYDVGKQLIRILVHNTKTMLMLKPIYIGVHLPVSDTKT